MAELNPEPHYQCLIQNKLFVTNYIIKVTEHTFSVPQINILQKRSYKCLGNVSHVLVSYNSPLKLVNCETSHTTIIALQLQYFIKFHIGKLILLMYKTIVNSHQITSVLSPCTIGLILYQPLYQPFFINNIRVIKFHLLLT